MKKQSKKLLLSVWWNNRRILSHEFMKLGEIINIGVYSAQLKRVYSALLQKQPSFVTRRGVILQHDNTRYHIAQKTQETITLLNLKVLSHPPYFPDLLASNYHLVLNLQNSFDCKNFTSEDHDKMPSCHSSNNTIQTFFKKRISDLTDR